MNAIINTKLIMEDGIIWDGVVTYENGKIVEAGWKKDVTIPDGAQIIDAQGLYTAPGLVDIHNHGCPTCDFIENPTEACEFFLAHGATTVLPTLYHASNKEEMIEGAKKIREEQGKGAGKIMDGLYMEGPFMLFIGGNMGTITWDEEISKEDYVDLIDSLGDMVRVWAIDPDRTNIEEFMAYAKEHTPQAIFAHGHSRSTFEDIQKLKHYGVKVRTHITDAGQAKGRILNTSIGPGGDHFCLYDPDMYAELICDEVGVHVPPGMIKMIIRTKGVERICLISDHTCFHGENHKNSEEDGVWFGPDLNYDSKGRLCGSKMTLDDGVRNVMTHTGYGLCHAIRMASLTPAQLVGIDDKVGSIAPGKNANLIIIDDAVNIKKVILEGELAVENGKVLI